MRLVYLSTSLNNSSIFLLSSSLIFKGLVLIANIYTLIYITKKLTFLLAFITIGSVFRVSIKFGAITKGVKHTFITNSFVFDVLIITHIL